MLDVQLIDVERRWTWEEEKMLEAYNCKKHMDEFRKNNCNLLLK